MRSAGILLSIVVASSGCSAGLRRAAQTTEVLSQVSLACDGLSTSTAVKSGRFYETNPVIYYQPTDGQLGMYFGSISVLSLGLNRAAEPLFGKHGDVASIARIAMNTALIALEVDSVQNNRDQGVSMCGL